MFYSPSSHESIHAFDFGAVLFEHSIAIAFKTIQYFFFFSFPELVYMSYILLKLTTIRCFVMYLPYSKDSLKDFSTTSVLTPSFLS